MSVTNTPTPSVDDLIPTVEQFLANVNSRFADNKFGLTTEADFRATFAELAQVFADWRHLSVKRVKGATFPVPFTDSLGLVPPNYRVLGMQAVALNGVDAATAAAGVVAPQVFFTLLKDSTGPINALLDTEATTTLTVKARWVQTSGTDEDKLAQFEFLELEDRDYAAGDVVKFEYPNGAIRLIEWRADSVGYQHPVPTGEDSDPIYAPFALPVATASYDDTALRNLIAGHEYRLGVLETTAPVVLPTSRVLWVQGGGQMGGLGTVGNPFATVPAAQNAAQDGDVIRVLPGGTATDALGRRCYPNVTIITKNVFIVCDPGVVFSGVWNVGNFGSFAPVNARIWGGEWLSELSLLRQGNGASFLQVEQARFTGLGYFLAFGRPNSGNYLDVATLRNCYFNSLQAANTSGPVQIFGRDDAQQQMQVVLDSCTVISQAAPCVTFSANPLSRLVLQGTTEFRALAGQLVYNPIQTAPSNSVYPVSQWVVDERQALGTVTPPAAGGAGIDYANPVTHTAAVALSAADFGKQHRFAGTGVALWTVPLPDPAGHANEFIELVVTDGASGMWAFQAADINGQPERRLWGGEVALLQVNSAGTGYLRKSGTTKPLCARIQANGAGNIAFVTNAFFTLSLPTVLYDQSPGGLMTAIANQLTVLRGGKYTLNGSFMGKYYEQNPELDLLCSFNGNYANLGTLTDLGSCYQPANVTANIRLKITGVMNLQAGNFYSIQLFSQAPGELDNRGNNPSYIPALELVENPSWT